MFSKGAVGQELFRAGITAGTIGTLEGSAPARTIPARNGRSDRCGVWQITPIITLEPRSYTIKINGVEVSATGETLSELGANMAIAMQGASSVNRHFKVAATDTPEVAGLITLTHRNSGVNAEIESADFLVQQMTSPRPASYLPFGRFVGSKPEWASVRGGIDDTWLLESSEQINVGVAHQVYLPQSEIDPAAKVAYPPKVEMEIITSCGANHGIWVEAVPGEAIAWDAPLYSSSVAGQEGMLTAIADNNVALPRVTVEKLPVTTPDGRVAVLVHF